MYTERRTTDRPYVSTVRTAAAAKTRDRLLRAARAILRSKRPADLTIDAVAERGGVSRMTVYNQFGSKRGLVEAVADDSAARGGLARLAEVFATDDPVAALHLVVEIFVNFWSTEYAVVRSLRALGRLDPDVAPSMRDQRRKGIVLRQLSRIGHEPDAEVIVALTSFETYEMLRAGRSTDDVVDLIWSACEKLLA